MMRSVLKRALTVLLTIAVIGTTLSISAFSVKADASFSVDLEVQYGQTEARAMLDYINRFRAGQDEDGQKPDYWNSDNTTKTDLTGQLQPLTYDYSLERTAMQRAAEIAVSFSHTRPNGTSCFTAWDGSIVWNSRGENIAAGSSSVKAAFVQWREDNDDYSGQGHRRNMLDQQLTRVGIGHVVLNGVHYWVQDFGRGSGDDNQTSAEDGIKTVSLEIAESSIQSLSYQTSEDDISLTVGESCALPGVTASFLLANAWPGRNTEAAVPAEWNSEDSNIAVIDGSILRTINIGSTQITAAVNGTVIHVPVTVLAPVPTTAIIEVDSETVPSGTAPVNRPETAAVEWSNGTITTETILWDKGIEKKDYTIRAGGETVYHGTVQGLDVYYTVCVEKAAVIGTEPLPAIEIYTTAKNLNQYLPKTVKASWSDGEPEAEAEIQWNNVPASFTEAGTYEVLGTVDGSITVSQTFIVKKPVLTELKWKTLPSVTNYTLGDRLEADGIVTAVYDSGDKTNITVTSDMVSGFDSSSIGTISLTVAYQDKTVSYDVVISPAALKSITLEYSAVEYDGEVKEPDAVVKAVLNGKQVTLSPDTDYTISYKNNLNAGTATVTATGLGNFSGKLTKTFTIEKVALKSATLKTTSYVYDGTAKKPAATVKATVGGETVTLVSGTNYKITYTDNKAIGTATATITGTGNYSGTIKKTFKITKVPLKSATLKTTSFVYNGNARKPSATVKAKVGDTTKTLTSGTDYKITYKNNKNAGTATATITGTGNYTGTLTKTFTITKVKIASAALKTTSFAYNGSARKPAVTVKAKVNGATKTLTKGTDYQVTYSNNKNAGTAKVTVTGIGNFKGTLNKSFTIKKVKLASATVKTASYIYDGTAKTPAVVVKASVGGTTKTLTKGTDYKVTYGSNVNVGKGKVTITGIGNFSGTITKTFVISPRTYVCNINKNNKEHIFHEETCKSVKLMKESNKLYVTDTRENIIAMGYRPCQNCNP